MQRATVACAWLAGCAAIALLAAPALAQPDQATHLTAADYARAEARLAHHVNRLVGGPVAAPVWQRGERLFWLQRDDGRVQLRAWDAANNAAVPLVDAQALAQALAKAAGKPVEADTQLEKIRDWRWQENGEWRFQYAGGDYRCATAPETVCERQAKRGADGDGPGTPSPDGTREVFIRNWNLWLREIASGKETQLTRDGQTDYGYATDNAGWTHSDRAIVGWSPDSKKIATFQQDQRKTSTMTLVATNVGAPKVEQWKYPFVGDEHVTMIERVIIDASDLAAPKTIRLQLPPDQHRSTFCDDVSCEGGWEDVQWARDGNTLAFVSSDRGHQWAQLRVANAATGAVRDVYRETVKTQYESGNGAANWRYLPETGEFLWFSEASDWGHLALHDLATGKRKRQITAGAWNVTQIAHVDAASRTIWFRGVGRESGRDPYFTHFYRVSMDGGQPQLLTPETADHKIVVSENGAYFANLWSTTSAPPVLTLRSMRDGKALAELARADISRLHATGWRAPETFTVKARDGAIDLYGMLFKPAAFAAGKRYPLVVYVYPGPQTGSIRTRSFAAAHLDHQALAELGFIVIAVDGMGTPWRSKSFHDAYYGNMIDNTLPDQVAAVRQLVARHAWIDGERVGIWGHSGGGNATATAMFRYPDVFKVGVAQAGNHNNLSYEDDWAERYHGLLRKRPDGTSNYTGQDNAAYAKHLQGKLFLIHGMMDDNVPPQNTLLVVDALVKANKDFDLLLLPHARHSFGSGADGMYVMRRRWDYFVTHLLGARPPAQYTIQPAP